MFVLVVDDDPIVRMTHLALLAKLPELKAAGASCIAETRREVQKRQPDAVLLDMQLPDGNGLEVMSLLDEQCGYGTRGPAARVVIVSAQLEPEQPARRPSPRLHKLAKPVQLRELLAYFRSAPPAPESLAPFAINDYVQLACAGAHSVRLQCSGPQGSGEIQIFVAASTGIDLSGSLDTVGPQASHGQLFGAAFAPATNRLYVRALYDDGPDQPSVRIRDLDALDSPAHAFAHPFGPGEQLHDLAVSPHGERHVYTIVTDSHYDNLALWDESAGSATLLGPLGGLSLDSLWVPGDCVASESPEAREQALDQMARVLKADVRETGAVKLRR